MTDFRVHSWSYLSISGGDSSADHRLDRRADDFHARSHRCHRGQPGRARHLHRQRHARGMCVSFWDVHSNRHLSVAYVFLSHYMLLLHFPGLLGPSCADLRGGGQWCRRPGAQIGAGRCDADDADGRRAGQEEVGRPSRACAHPQQGQTRTHAGQCSAAKH